MEGQTNNVIGYKTDADDRLASWLTLRMLRESLTYMRGKDPIKYSNSIEKERAIYGEILQEYVSS